MSPPFQLPVRTRWLVAGGVGLLVLGLVTGLVIAGANQSPKSAGSGAAAGTVQGGGPKVTSHEGELVTITGSVDGFERPDNPVNLGAMPAGLPWRAAVGTWGIAAAQAAATTPLAGRNVAVVDAGRADEAVQVRVAKVTNGSGVVFRYRDPGNFWAVVAAPGYATWAIVKVVAGKDRVVGNTGLSPVADGTAVGVRAQGDTIDVLVDGRVTTTFGDVAFKDATMAGLTVEGLEGGKARFDDFRVAQPGGQPLPPVPGR
jgi:hypothetical protein